MTAPARPRVSVVMPVYNGARFLREAVDSVLAQSFGELELVVVDDGSTDDTPAILESYGDPRLRVLRNERNSGIVVSLNRGVSAAAAPIIARQDADDVSEPHRLAVQLRHLQADPSIVLLGAGYRPIDEDGVLLPPRAERPTDDERLRWALLFSNQFTHTSVVFSRSAFDVAGGYRYEERHAEDYGLWSRMAGIGRVAARPEPLVRYRFTGGSLSHTWSAVQWATARDISLGNLEGTAGTRLRADARMFLRAVAVADTAWLAASEGRGVASELANLTDDLDALLDQFVRVRRPRRPGAFRQWARRDFAARATRSARRLAASGDAAGAEVAPRLLSAARRLDPFAAGRRVVRSLAFALQRPARARDVARGSSDQL